MGSLIGPKGLSESGKHKRKVMRLKFNNSTRTMGLETENFSVVNQVT